jgi:hypothetical protein
MADDLKHRGPPDPSKINVHEPWELEYWTKKFGVTADRLREAVKAVGTSVKAVTEHLRKR